MSANGVDWGETKAILLEVEQLFNRDDDIRDVQDVKKMSNEIEVHCANNLKDAKEIIKRKLFFTLCIRCYSLQRE